MLFLKVWSSNNKPGIVARYYYEYLEESCSKSFYFTFTYTFFKAEFSDFSGIKLVYSEIRLGISSEWKELFWTLPPITNSLQEYQASDFPLHFLDPDLSGGQGPDLNRFNDFDETF